MQYDPRAQAYYDRARYYDPRNGVFLSRDPLPAVNPYSFAGGDPIDFGDPSGTTLEEYGKILDWDLEFSERITGCVVGVVTSLVSNLGSSLIQHGTPDLRAAAADVGLACAVGTIFPDFGRVRGEDPTDAALASWFRGLGVYVAFSAVVGFLLGTITDVLNQAICGKGISWGHAFLAGGLAAAGSVLFTGIFGLLGVFEAATDPFGIAMFQIGNVSVGSIFGLIGALDPGPCG
jgi:hypothetical protein